MAHIHAQRHAHIHSQPWPFVAQDSNMKRLTAHGSRRLVLTPGVIGNLVVGHPVCPCLLESILAGATEVLQARFFPNKL